MPAATRQGPWRLFEWPLAALGCAFSWVAGGELGAVSGYFAAKAYYDTTVQGPYDLPAHMNALEFALHDGTSAGQLFAAVVFVISYGALRDRLGMKALALALCAGIAAASFAGYAVFGSFPWGGALKAVLASAALLAAAAAALFWVRKNLSPGFASVLWSAALLGTVALQLGGFALAQQSTAQFAAAFGASSPENFCDTVVNSLVTFKKEQNPGLDLDRLRAEEMRKCLEKHE